MKRIVKYSLLTILIILTIMSAGCYPTGPRPVENIDDIWAEAAKIDNFSISLTLPENTPSELPEVTADMMRWERDELLELSEKGKTIDFEEEYISDMSSEEKLTSILFDDGTHLYFEPSRLSFDMLPDSPIYSIYMSVQSIIPQLANCEVEGLTLVNEIEGFPKSDAINMAKELAEKLGITNLGEPRVLGLTHQDAEKYYNNRYRNNEDFELKEWTEDEDAYFIIFPLLLNGIPTDTNEMGSMQSLVKAVVTRENIIDFGCHYVTSSDYTNGKTIKINCSASDILKRIVSDNSNKQLQNAVDYYDCELIYARVEWLPGCRYRYIPVWRFDYTETVDFGDVWNKLRKYELYDVETGNRIE